VLSLSTERRKRETQEPDPRTCHVKSIRQWQTPRSPARVNREFSPDTKIAIRKGSGRPCLRLLMRDPPKCKTDERAAQVRPGVATPDGIDAGETLSRRRLILH